MQQVSFNTTYNTVPTHTFSLFSIIRSLQYLLCIHIISRLAIWSPEKHIILYFITSGKYPKVSRYVARESIMLANI